jgi:hypothetical protein
MTASVYCALETCERRREAALARLADLVAVVIDTQALLAELAPRIQHGRTRGMIEAQMMVIRYALAEAEDHLRRRRRT